MHFFQAAYSLFLSLFFSMYTFDTITFTPD